MFILDIGKKILKKSWNLYNTKLPMPLVLLIFLIIHISVGLLGSQSANNKGRSKMGWFFLCFVFPPFILLINCLTNKADKNCYETDKTIQGGMVLILENIWQTEFIQKNIWMIYITILLVPIIFFILIQLC